MARYLKCFVTIGVGIVVLVTLAAVSAGAGEFRNLSQCIRNGSQVLHNECGQPVIATYCFGMNDATKPCDTKTLSLAISLMANETKSIGLYHNIYYFACEAPGVPDGVAFDGSGLIGGCRPPQMPGHE